MRGKGKKRTADQIAGENSISPSLRREPELGLRPDGVGRHLALPHVLVPREEHLHRLDDAWGSGRLVVVEHGGLKARWPRVALWLAGEDGIRSQLGGCTRRAAVQEAEGRR